MIRLRRSAVAIVLVALAGAASAQELPGPVARALAGIKAARRAQVDKLGHGAPMRLAVVFTDNRGAVVVEDLTGPERIIDSVPGTVGMLRQAWLSTVTDKRIEPDGKAVQAVLAMDWRGDEKADLHIQATFAGFEMTGTRWSLVSARGKPREVDNLADDDAFVKHFDRHLSVRAAWRHLLAIGAMAPTVQTLKVAPDYVLMLRPAGRTPMARADLEDDAVEQTRRFLADYPDGSLLDLADIAREPFIVPDNYAAWLGREAGRVGRKQVGAFVLIDYGSFIDMTVKQLADSPFKVQTDGQAVFLTDPDEGLAVRIRLGEAMLKTAYAGLTQCQGMRRYVCRPLAALPHMVKLKRVIAARVAPAYTAQVVEGTRLEFTEAKTGKVHNRVVDLMDATSRGVEANDQAALDKYLAQAAGFDPKTSAFVARTVEIGKGNIPVKLVVDPRDAQLLSLMGYITTVDDTFGYAYFLQYPDEMVPLGADNCKLDAAALDRLVAESLGKISGAVAAADDIRLGAQRCKVAVGDRLSRVWTDPRLARNLLEAVSGDEPLPRRISLFLVSDNVVVFAPRDFDKQDAEKAAASAIAYARTQGLDPGTSLFGWRTVRLPGKGLGTFELKK